MFVSHDSVFKLGSLIKFWIKKIC